MGESSVESQGFTIGRWWFPPFSLRNGTCVSLSFPIEAVVDRDAILEVLAGLKPAEGLTIRAKVVVAQPATMTTGWWQPFARRTPFDWMKKHSNLPDDAIVSFLVKYRMDGPLSLNRYAGTPRTLMGLAAAYSQQPGVLVFSTTGLDPTGTCEVFQLVAEHAPQCATIYLAWPIVCQGKILHEIPAGSEVVSVVEQNRSSVRSGEADAPSHVPLAS